MIFIIIVFLSVCTEKKEAQTIIWEQTKNNNDLTDNIYEGMLSEPVICGQKNTYDTLNVATYITKVDDTYFIADCYHNQIIYNENLTDPLNQWNVLTDKVHYAHTIASDGVMFLVDDTENNRLLVF